MLADKLGPYDLDTIITGDARELAKAIPDESVDLIFTWSKQPGAIARYVRALSTPGAIVADFFTGGGTVPAVCKMLDRRYLAFEIDPDTADLARERVRQTQPSLPGLVVEQGKFLLDSSP